MKCSNFRFSVLYIYYMNNDLNVWTWHNFTKMRRPGVNAETRYSGEEGGGSIFVGR